MEKFSWFTIFSYFGRYLENRGNAELKSQSYLLLYWKLNSLNPLAKSEMTIKARKHRLQIINILKIQFSRVYQIMLRMLSVLQRCDSRINLARCSKLLYLLVFSVILTYLQPAQAAYIRTVCIVQTSCCYYYSAVRSRSFHELA